MTTNVRESTAEVPSCHVASNDDPQRGEIDRVPPTRRDDRISIAWRPSKWHLAIAGGVAALAIVVTAALVFDIGLGNLGLFAVVLLCPLMHIFMMRGMGQGGQQGCHGSQQSSAQTSSQPKDDKA